MAKAEIVNDIHGRFYGIDFTCPGCSEQGPGWPDGHCLPVDWTPEGVERSPNINGRPIWSFDGNLNLPTLSPSILSRTPQGPGAPDFVCHSFVRAGRIEFLSDCSHALAGQTVELPDVDDSEAPAHG